MFITVTVQLVANMKAFLKSLTEPGQPFRCNKMMIGDGANNYLLQEHIKIELGIAILFLFVASLFIPIFKKLRSKIINYSPSIFVFLLSQVFMHFVDEAYLLDQDPSSRACLDVGFDGLIFVLWLGLLTTFVFLVLSLFSELTQDNILKNACLVAFLCLLSASLLYIDLGFHPDIIAKDLFLRDARIFVPIFVLVLFCSSAFQRACGYWP